MKESNDNSSDQKGNQNEFGNVSDDSPEIQIKCRFVDSDQYCMKLISDIQKDAHSKLIQSHEYLQELEKTQKNQIISNIEGLKNLQDKVSLAILAHINLLELHQCINTAEYLQKGQFKQGQDTNFFQDLLLVKSSISNQHIGILDNENSESKKYLKIQLEKISQHLLYKENSQLDGISQQEKRVLQQIYNNEINSVLNQNLHEIYKIGNIIDHLQPTQDLNIKFKDIIEKQQCISQSIIPLEDDTIAQLSSQDKNYSDQTENNKENMIDAGNQQIKKVNIIQGPGNQSILKHEDSEISQSTAYQTPQQKAEIFNNSQQIQQLSQLDQIRQEIGNIKIQAQQEQIKQQQQQNQFSQSHFFKTQQSKYLQQQQQQSEINSNQNQQQQLQQQLQSPQTQSQQQSQNNIISQQQHTMDDENNEVKIEECDSSQLLNDSKVSDQNQQQSQLQQSQGILNKKTKKIYKRKCANAFQRDKNRQILFEALLNKYEVCRKYDVSETYINNLALDCVINNDIQYKKRLEELCQNKNFRQQKWMFGQTIHQLQRKKLGKLHMCTEPPPEKIQFKYQYNPMASVSQNNTQQNNCTKDKLKQQQQIQQLNNNIPIINLEQQQQQQQYPPYKMPSKIINTNQLLQKDAFQIFCPQQAQQIAQQTQIQFLPQQIPQQNLQIPIHLYPQQQHQQPHQQQYLNNNNNNNINSSNKLINNVNEIK